MGCCLLGAALVRLLLAAAVRLWFLEESFSAPALEAPAVWAKAQATADRRRAACGLLAAAVVRLLLAAAVRLWFLEGLISAPALGEPVLSGKATAVPRPARCRLFPAPLFPSRPPTP